MSPTARLLGLGVISLTTSACEFFVSPDVRAARQEAASRVAFVRPVTAGYEVAATDGRVERVVSKEERPWVSSYTPDFSGYSYVLVRNDAPSGDRWMVYVRLSGLEPVALLSTKIEAGQEFSHELVWASTDGSSFLLEQGGLLQRFSRCDDVIRRQILAEGFKSYTVSYGTLYFLSNDEPQKLFWKRLAPDGRPIDGAVDLDDSFSGLTAGTDGERLLGFRESRRRQGVREHLAWIDTTSGESQRLSKPRFSTFFRCATCQHLSPRFGSVAGNAWTVRS